MPTANADTVVLLHGLTRSSKSMQKMEYALQKAGYQTLNIDYPSTSHPIEQLSTDIRSQIMEEIAAEEPIHFVTHSMGGIILRQIQKTEPLPNLQRAVMLAPPNNGSEVVDKLKDLKIFQKLNGPAGQQLGTASEDFVQHLGPVTNFELGVITGDRSINWILSTMIPGKDDGKVSIESAQVDGMKAFKILHTTHPFIMKKKAVITETIHFIEKGRFTEPTH